VYLAIKSSLRKGIVMPLHYMVRIIFLICVLLLALCPSVEDLFAAPLVQGITGVVLVESGQILYQLPDQQSAVNGIYPAQTPFHAQAVYEDGGCMS
jgi:hypothetical protein